MERDMAYEEGYGATDKL
nr:T cell receptor delta 4 {V-D-J junction} [mice, intestinal intraepithelial lymphocytes, Peptide Partial, 17 aa] [Mus sp.]